MSIFFSSFDEIPGASAVVFSTRILYQCIYAYGSHDISARLRRVKRLGFGEFCSYNIYRRYRKRMYGKDETRGGRNKRKS